MKNLMIVVSVIFLISCKKTPTESIDNLTQVKIYEPDYVSSINASFNSNSQIAVMECLLLNADQYFLSAFAYENSLDSVKLAVPLGDKIGSTYKFHFEYKPVEKNGYVRFKIYSSSIILSEVILFYVK